MKIIRGSKLDSTPIGDLSAGQVFEHKKKIGIITTKKTLGVLTVVYLNNGDIEDLKRL